MALAALLGDLGSHRLQKAQLEPIPSTFLCTVLLAPSISMGTRSPLLRPLLQLGESARYIWSGDGM